MNTSCAHPTCRTSLTDETAVYCDHGLPFCEHCTWEDGCEECNRVSGGPCFPFPVDGHNCTLAEGHAGPHVCCDGHAWGAA